MAKKKADAADEDADAAGTKKKKKKKKPVVLIVIVLLGLFGAKTFLLKPAPKTAKQLAAEEKQKEQDLYNTCAEANGKPTLADVATGATTPPSSTGQGAPRRERVIAVRLVSLQAESHTGVPVVEGMGPILELDSKTVNLRDGSYLKIGVALQLAEGVSVTAVKDEGLGAKAQAIVLAKLARYSMRRLTPPALRDRLKADLGFEVCRDYKGKVLTVYFTEFVMQAA